MTLKRFRIRLIALSYARIRSKGSILVYSTTEFQEIIRARVAMTSSSQAPTLSCTEMVGTAYSSILSPPLKSIGPGSTTSMSPDSAITTAYCTPQYRPLWTLFKR